MTPLRRAVHRLHREQVGAESVEFALVLPVLVVLTLGVLPLLDFIVVTRDVGRVVDEAAVFATRASSNPARTTDGSAVCGDLSRRRSYAQVREFALAGNPRLTEVDIYVQPPGSGTPGLEGRSTADPCRADPTSRIHVRLTGEYTTGPLAASVNAVARLFGASGNIVPERATLTAVSASYLE